MIKKNPICVSDSKGSYDEEICLLNKTGNYENSLYRRKAINNFLFSSITKTPAGQNCPQVFCRIS